MKFQRTWIYLLYWKIKFNIRLLLSHRGVDHYLDLRTSDWTIDFADWPTWDRRCRFHYKCKAYSFFDYGTGLGRTAKEAAERAVRNMENKSRKVRLESKYLLKMDPDDLKFGD